MPKLIDLRGWKFYELTVISRYKSPNSRRTKWNCLCYCGKSVVATSYDLTHGKHRSCGHDRKHPYIDLTGKRFGELEVLSRNEDGTWTCLCNCGNTTNVHAYDLSTGHTRTCGHTRSFIDLTGKQFGDWKVLRCPFFLFRV